VGKAKTAFAKHQIDDLLDNVVKKAEVVRVCAEALIDETLVTTMNVALSIQKSSNRTEDGIELMSRTLSDEIHEIGSRIKNLEDTTLDIKNGVVELLLDEVLSK
jgi:polyhydroxyalkanoate synthesis regulator phasin